MHWERLDESIKVRADFRAGEITPLLLKRGQSALRVVSVNSRWMCLSPRDCQVLMPACSQFRSIFLTFSAVK